MTTEFKYNHRAQVMEQELRDLVAKNAQDMREAELQRQAESGGVGEPALFDRLQQVIAGTYKTASGPGLLHAHQIRMALREKQASAAMRLNEALEAINTLGTKE